MEKGKLYIIPITISDADYQKVLPDYNHEICKRLRHFAVENIKTARRFLRMIDREFPIDDSSFYQQDKHDDYAFSGKVIEQLKNGYDVGLMSESGYPAIADPGNLIVARVQEIGAKVIPLVGPSSILMALAASGLNGQGFTFNGYLPVRDPERSKQLKFIASLVEKTGNSQLFIETPYRNETIFKDFVKNCAPGLKLCVAYDVTGENESILTKTISDWSKNPFKFDKTPCVFILGK